MRIKNGFTLRSVAGNFIVMNLGGELDFNGMITLNETGAFIWKGVEDGKSIEEIAEAISQEYEIDFQTALNDTKGIIAKMLEAGVVE